MDLATQAHLPTLRGLLDDRQCALRAKVQAARLARQQAGDTGGREVEDRKEEVTRRQLEGIEDVQGLRDMQELAEVEAALQRLNSGRYGDCVDCDLPISLERLQVQPATLRCAQCQGAHERLRVMPPVLRAESTAG